MALVKSVSKQRDIKDGILLRLIFLSFCFLLKMILILFNLIWRETWLCCFCALSGIILSIIFLLGTNESTTRSPYHKFKVLRLSPTNEEQLAELRYLQLTDERLDFWTDANALNTTVDVMISPDNLNSFYSFLHQKNIPYEVFFDDVQRVIDLNAAEQRQNDLKNDSRSLSRISFSRYHRTRSIYRFLRWLSIFHPSFVKVINIGKSFHGRPLRVIKIGKPTVGRKKPAIWIDAGTHAREWIAPATAVYIIDQLVHNFSEHRELIEEVDWYILPVANPDGYEYSHTHLRLWRKTRRAVSGGCIGVDPNRNFDFFWNTGTSNNPCSDNYAGEKPFSEPETKAFADFVSKRKNIKVYISLHSYKQLILIPWGHNTTKPHDFQDLFNLGQHAVNAIYSVSGTRYKVGSAIELLYSTSGGSRDWAKGIAGIKYSYTIELRDSGKFGFLLPASEIFTAAHEIMEAIKVFAEKALRA